MSTPQAYLLLLLCYIHKTKKICQTLTIKATWPSEVLQLASGCSQMHQAPQQGVVSWQPVLLLALCCTLWSWPKAASISAAVGPAAQQLMNVWMHCWAAGQGYMNRQKQWAAHEGVHIIWVTKYPICTHCHFAAPEHDVNPLKPVTMQKQYLTRQRHKAPLLYKAAAYCACVDASCFTAICFASAFVRTHLLYQRNAYCWKTIASPLWLCMTLDTFVLEHTDSACLHLC